MALAIYDIIAGNWKVNFWEDDDAKNKAIDDIDDYLYDEIRGNREIPLSTEQMDEIIEQSMKLARNRISS
jgi:type I restriction enzyme R subunit